MVKEFHLRNKSVSYTKAQIQEKEGQLKRDYKMLKAARMQSGSKWNEKRNMVEGSDSMWANLAVTFPKIKKFRNSKATFPLFDDLGELYDGHLAEGNYNFTSIESSHEEAPLQQIHEVEDDAQDEEEALHQIHEVADEDEDTSLPERNGESEVAPVARSGQRRTASSRDKPEKEERRLRKGAKIEGLMERFLEVRTKEAEVEAAHLAREEKERQKKSAQGDDFSIKKCISVLDTMTSQLSRGSSMEMTKQEKAKACTVFTKSKENREAFICASEVDQEVAMIWLRNEMA